MPRRSGSHNTEKRDIYTYLLVFVRRNKRHHLQVYAWERIYKPSLFVLSTLPCFHSIARHLLGLAHPHGQMATKLCQIKRCCENKTRKTSQKGRIIQGFFDQLLPQPLQLVRATHPTFSVEAAGESIT